MDGLADHRRGAANGTTWVLEVRRIIRRAAHLTDVPILLSGPALGIRAGAADKAVWQKTPVLFAVILRYRTRHDMTLLAQALEDIFRVLTVFRTVGRVKTIKGNVEIGKIALMLNVILSDKVLGRHSRTLGIDFDGRPMRIISAHIHHIPPRHFEKAHEDISLDILDEMAQMNTSVGVGQSAGDENWVSHGLPYLCLPLSRRGLQYTCTLLKAVTIAHFAPSRMCPAVHGRRKEHRGATV